MTDHTDHGPAPRTFGRYQVIGEIGRGGMGVVWKAWDPRLDRHVALKFLPDDRSQHQSARERFIREGRTASRLKHDGIATVFDAGEVEGKSYLAFEFVDGESVSKRLEKGPFPAAEAVRVAIAALDALAHAHEKAVYHRDITPGNLMITRDGRMIIVDFGLAAAEGMERLTRSGETGGTIAYMSPEALRGFAPDDDPAMMSADLYGLGVTLYEMLTGSLPFDAPALPQLVYAITHQDPTPPTDRVNTLPAALDAVVLRAIAKDPSRRYGNALEFSAALTELLGTLPEVPPDEAIVRPLSDRTHPPSRPTAARIRRRHAMMSLIAIAAMAVAVAAYLLLRPGVGKPAFASVAVLPFEVSGPEIDIPPWLTSGLGRQTVVKLSKLHGVRVVTWTSSQRFRTTAMSLKDIARELGVDALVVGSIERKGTHIVGSIELVNGENEFVHWSGTFDQSENDLFAIESEIATGVARGIFGDVSRDAAGMLATPASHSVEAYEHYLRGAQAMQTNMPEANATALAFFERALELDPNLVDAMVGVGAVHVNRHFFGWEGGSQNLDIARTYFEKALALEPDNRDALRGLMSQTYESVQAIATLKLGKRVDVGPDASVDDLLTRAQGYVMSGLPVRAIPLLRRALAIEPSNPAVVFWLVVGDNWSAAYEDCIRDAELFFDKFGDDPEIHLWVADSYTWLGDTDAALIHARRSLELFGDYPQDYAEGQVATLLMRTGHKKEGERLLRTAIARLEHSLAANPGNRRYMRSLALAHAYAADTTRFKEIVSEMRSASTWKTEELAFYDSYYMLGMRDDARRVLCSTEWVDVMGGTMAIGAREAGLENDPELSKCLADGIRAYEKRTAKY